MARILVAGVAVVDFVFQVEELPRKAEKYRAEDAVIVGGGCAANAAVAISRLGGQAQLAARIGDDAVGDIILNDLEKAGVDTHLVYRSPGGRSSFSSVYVDREGERQIMNFRGSSLASDTGWADLAGGVDAVLADNRWPPLTRKAIEIAKDLGVPVVIDAEHPLEPAAIEGASHIAFSLQGLRDFARNEDIDGALRKAADRYKAWTCVTEGANGVRYLRNGQLARLPAYKVKAVDTLGAGDVWHGAFTLALARGATERDAIVYANAAAALKCTSGSGRLGAPDTNAVDIFLKENAICT